MGDCISNTTNNFTQNTGDTINYYFKPNKYFHNYYGTQLKNVAQEHLGIIYQPFTCLNYLFTGFTGLVAGDDDIVIHIVPISLYGVDIIPEYTFNFTTFMSEDFVLLGQIHNMYLNIIDFICVGFLFTLAYRKWKEMTNK